MEYYSVIKNEILAIAPACMYLEGTMLSEIGQAEKDREDIISVM